MPAALRIEVVRSIADAYARVEEDALAGYGFQSRAWLEAYAATLGTAAGERPLIVLVSDDRVRLVLPLSIATRRGVRTLAFLGGGVTDYHAPLVDPGFAGSLGADAVAALWRRIRSALPRHDVVRFARMPETLDPPAGAGAGAVPNPFAQLPGAVVTGRGSAVSLAAGKPAATRSAAGDIRRCRRRLEEIAPLVLEVAESPAARAAMLDPLLGMKARRWRETGARDWSGVAAFRAFYGRVAALAGDGPAVHAAVIRCGDAPIAAHLGFVHRARFYFLLFGWEGEWRRFGPGLQFVDALLGAAVADGAAVFDFTAGDEAYKTLWADRTLPLLSWQAAASLRGRAVLIAEAGIARARARLKRVRRLRALVRRVFEKATAGDRG